VSDMVVRRYRKDGAPIMLKVFISPLVDDNGRTFGSLEILNEIKTPI
jgi:hypothetical protein